MSWPLACPACGVALGDLPIPAAPLACPGCAARYPVVDGVLDLVPPARAAGFERFLAEYGQVRLAEGRGSDSPDWYRDLPVVRRGEPLAWQWRIRARSCRALLRRVLPGLGPGPLAVLDLGAGCGWLGYRLALAGHRPLALDLSLDARDGLGAARHFDGALPAPLPRARAEYDQLPLPDGAAEVAVFNASLHYSPDYAATLAEATRAIGPGGAVVVMDSPLYRGPAAGAAMVAERRAAFRRRYGFASDALGSREYLVAGELEALAGRLGLEGAWHWPWYGLSWALRPWRARLAGRREPSRFGLWVGRRPPGSRA